MVKEEVRNLSFLFTETGFVLDTVDREQQDSKWFQRFQEDKYSALYDFGFQERIHQLHASTGFLHRTAELYIHVLTSLSELEIAREQVQITLPVDIWEQLQKELPFAIGSEFITYKWVQNIFVHLHEVFCREISRYEGSAKLYLAEKNQNLKVAERIFFHLVESKDEEYPFAFLATYATKDQEGRIRHMPLRYALEEFKQERDRLLTLLSCLNKAAKTCDLLDSFIAHGELFHPLRLQTQEAYEILKHTEEIDISICNGEWLQSFLQSLHKPAEHQSDHVPATLQAVLRPYQKAGYSWLRQMQQVHFGACLADDMGLGKTLQVLSFLEELRLEKPDSKVLLIIPASLLGNWSSEGKHFLYTKDGFSYIAWQNK